MIQFRMSLVSIIIATVSFSLAPILLPPSFFLKNSILESYRVMMYFSTSAEIVNTSTSFSIVTIWIFFIFSSFLISTIRPEVMQSFIALSIALSDKDLDCKNSYISHLPSFINSLARYIASIWGMPSFLQYLSARLKADKASLV